ncbi:MAG: MotA/TolQ/ExbB proton channel family protein [Deltaproteobacteria bacterium]|nr:MotA/TolQ/ExbB proton channel family protein [Deltaproteobacteria bacterium]
MISLLLAGGPFMFATLSVSLICVSIALWRFVFLWGRSSSRKSLLKETVAYAEQRSFGKALQLCNSSPSPLSRILAAAFSRSDRSEKEIRRGVEAVALEEIPKIKAGTVFLPQLSNLATLFGLIGTIHGLIIAFQGAGSENAATRQAILSQGIAIAFYNTFFGLSVATMAIVFYLLLINKTNNTLAFMEQSTASVIDAILWHRDDNADRRR